MHVAPVVRLDLTLIFEPAFNPCAYSKLILQTLIAVFKQFVLRIFTDSCYNKMRQKQSFSKQKSSTWQNKSKELISKKRKTTCTTFATEEKCVLMIM